MSGNHDIPGVPAAVPAGTPAPRNTAGRAALVLGILGLFTSLLVVGGLLGVAAIVFGIRGRSLARAREATNPGVATVGLAAGVLAVFTTLAVVGGTWTFFHRYGEDYQRYQDCRRAAETPQEHDACSRGFHDAVRTGTGASLGADTGGPAAR